MDTDSAAALAATVNWLEVEQHEGKDKLHRLQQLVDQLHAMLNDHSFRLQGAEETVEGLKHQSGKLPGLEEELRQIKDRSAQIQESHSEITRTLDKVERSKKSEDESTRESLREITRRIEQLEASGESMLGQHRAMETVLKRQQEQLDGLKTQHEEMRKEMDPLAQAVAFAQEQSRRVNERVEQLVMEMGPLRQQDDVIKNKMEVATHQAKHLEQRIDALNTDAQSRRDLPEKLDLQKANLERVERQALQSLQLTQKLSEALEKYGQHVRDVEARIKGLLDQMLRLQQKGQESQGRLDELLGAIGEMLEQDKKKQIADLEGQFRNLKERLARMRGAIILASGDNQ